MDRTSPSEGGNVGSIPTRSTIRCGTIIRMSTRVYALFATLLVLCFLLPSAYAISRRTSTQRTQKASVADQVSPAALAPSPSPTPQFHILIVPGHDTATGGGSYLNVYERDVAVEVAQDIAAILAHDTRIQIMIARDTAAWNTTLATYSATQEQEILSFKTEHQNTEKALLASGQKKIVSDIASHTSVDKKTAIQLYGINKWANEHDVDLLLHIHFNDSGRPNRAQPGSSHGFTLYIPESQLANSARSRDIARPIFASLKELLTPEVNAIVEDQSLIALGASGTLTKPSILIEYAYIYERPLREEVTRKAFVQSLAEKTAAGIETYLRTAQ